MNSSPQDPPSRPTLKQNRFFIGETPFEPIGFNYWPSRNGVDCWKDFDLRDWEEDFAEMRRRGYNTVRIFMIWPDFQPEEDRIDTGNLRKFKQAIQCAERHGLWVIPTFFQGWMSGTNFDPLWRAGRNHIQDLTLRTAMIRLVEAVCHEISDCRNLLALDLANEINVVCPEVTPESLRAWTGELRGAIQSIIKDMLVTNGTADVPIQAQSSWTHEDQDVDFLCMHGYPMFWTPLPFTSLTSARASQVFGGTVSRAAADGRPVMRQEYGVAMGGDGPRVEGFVATSSYASYLAGANGFLYWCWRDFATSEPPYQKVPFESSMGYMDASLKAKAWSKGYDAFKDFLLSHAGWQPVTDSVAILIPARFKQLDNKADTGLAFAYENLVANGITPRFTRSPDTNAVLLVVPVGELTLDEIAALKRRHLGGGRTIVCGLSSTSCCSAWKSFTGWQQTDLYRPDGPQYVQVNDNHRIQIDAVIGNLPWPWMTGTGSDLTVWLEGEEGIPLGLHTGGAGQLVQFLPPLAALGGRDIQAEYAGLFRHMLELAGFEPEITVSHPQLQAGRITGPEGQTELIVINHSSRKLDVVVAIADQTYERTLAGKTTEIIPL